MHPPIPGFFNPRNGTFQVKPLYRKIS